MAVPSSPSGRDPLLERQVEKYLADLFERPGVKDSPTLQKNIRRLVFGYLDMLQEQLKTNEHNPRGKLNYLLKDEHQTRILAHLADWNGHALKTIRPYRKALDAYADYLHEKPDYLGDGEQGANGRKEAAEYLVGSIINSALMALGGDRKRHRVPMSFHPKEEYKALDEAYKFILEFLNKRQRDR